MGVVLEIFRVLASTSSLLLILSPVPAVYQIHRKRSVGVASIIPLLSIFANCHIWMMYGALTSNVFPVIVTFGGGEIFGLAYVAVYYRWSTERLYLTKLVGSVVGFLAVSSLYALLGYLGVFGQSVASVADVVGYIGIGVSIVLFASPLEKISNVLKHRSAVFIPIHMVIAGLFNSLLWIVYSVMDKDWFLFAPNAACFILSVSQTILYLLFSPRTHPLAGFEEIKPTEIEAEAVDVIVVTPETDRPSNDGPAFQAMQSPRAP